ncbi:MAG: PAS domain-containing sensor histidine kinase [Candidatus Binatia bacterium]
MNLAVLRSELEAAERRQAALRRRVRRLGAKRVLPLPVVFEEMRTNLEVLRVAEEELRVQGEQLVAARTEAEASARRYQELFEFAPRGYLVTDPHGTILEVNGAAAALFGCRRDYMWRKPLARFVAREDSRAFLDRLGALRDGEAAGTESWELRFRGADGTEWPAAITVAAARDPEERLVELRWLVQDVTEQKRRDESIRQLSARLLHAHDEARRWFARELHDSMGQDLAALAANLARVRQSVAALDPGARAALQESRSLVQSCSRGIRTLAYLLHPPLLDESGLGSALRHFVDGFTNRSGIEVDLDIPRSVARFSESLELTVFRVVQECLTNAYRHSGTRTVAVRLRRGRTALEIEVRDRGRGIRKAQAAAPSGSRHAGVGLASIRERVTELGGRLEVCSDACGTTVRAALPVAKGEAR